MKTALFDQHVALGAKIVDFAGWEMPVHYSGVIEEHEVVRKNVGIFDVSHMGRVLIKGVEAEKLMDYLSTNRIIGKKDFSATYTIWCDQFGGCVDDLIVYREGAQSYFVVVNAGNREKDLNHLKLAAQNFDVTIEDRYDDGILAVQGPNARSLIQQIFEEGESLKPMRFVGVEYLGYEVILSGTGYTGSGGFELYGPMEAIVSLWGKIFEKGKEFGIQPIGLGARDTLRMEMGFPLYGYELTGEISPTESVASWAVKLEKENFLGKEILEMLEGSGEKRYQKGVVLLEKGIARHEHEIYKDNKLIGKVTSGTMSPSLKKSIAIILVERNLNQGEIVEIDIRGRRVNAKVVPLPFWRNE